MLFSTTALPKLRALQHLASRPVLPHSSLLDLGDATAVGCARRKLSCFKLRAPAFALVASRLDSSSTSPPLPSNTALHSTPSVKHAGLLPPHPDSARPFESLPSPSPSTWRHSLGEAPLCREPDFNSIDGLSHPKEETVSLLRNPELVMCPAGAPSTPPGLQHASREGELLDNRIVSGVPSTLDFFNEQLFIPQCFWSLRPCI